MIPCHSNLTQSLLKELFYYEEGLLKWNVDRGPNAKKGSFSVGVNSDGYCHVQVNGKSYKTHRLIFLYHHGYLPEQVDHINGIRDDNRIENLRAATNQTNQWNTRLQKNNTSGYKGVSYHKKAGKWRARSCNKNGRVSLGLYDTKEAAALAVKAYEKDNHVF